ncbi:MAG: EAL domain-containing protein [Deltaproteobacteria bacterium]|nr:EAL domain-containing protein [Deltaproteobacteria bacterium]
MATAWKRETPVREGADAAQKRARVLVVDDDAGIRRALARLLERDGLSVTAVGSAREALSAFADRAPDLAVLDLGLPDADGIELCEQLRAQPSGRDLPIILLTGSDAGDTLARAFDAGASDFARKSEPLAALVHRARFLLRAHRDRAALLASEARLRDAQDLARLASWRFALEMRALSGGAELWRLLGTARGVLPAIAEAERESLEANMRECLRSGRVVGGELLLATSGADARALRYRMRLALSEDGEPVALEGVVQDVSAWRRSETRAQFLADHDVATSLPNRASLLRALERSIASARETQGEISLVALGLDGSERIAETLGANAAAELRREAARRLTGNLEGFVALVDEASFALVSSSPASAEAAHASGERALALLDAPFRVGGHEVYLSTCAGVARFPHDGGDAEALLRAGERALAQARRGGPRVQAHSAETSAATLRRFTLASRLRTAIERGELVLHYQPKLALDNGVITGFEGLVRWDEPELGMLAPGEFVPIAEESGLVGRLGDWVMREACRQIVAWRDAGLGDVPIAVNVSPQQLRREGLAARVAELLRESGAPAHALGIEITETALLDDPERAIRELKALRELGIELALDDFGTGFSSLSYLRRLPVQIVKIDREFVREIATREDAAALTASIVAMAKALWLRVVAEGVEQESERELVGIWGCEEAQGFLFSRPVPAPEAERLWRERGPHSQRARAALH